MSEQPPNESISFRRFADWCRHIDSLSEEARYTVEMLLNEAGTDDVDDAEEAEQILSSMTELCLRYNLITDISFLGSLTNLTTLDLNSNLITDISSLGLLTNLTTLDLNCNKINDISSLGSLTNLTTLDLNENKITDISFLGSLTNLTELSLGNNRITDISFLSSLTNLTTLNLNCNKITDISFLSSLTNLTTLSLGNNRITDISFLSSLTNLTTLHLRYNQITDISSLSSLTNLTTLHLDCDRSTDISSLGSLTNLTTLDLICKESTDIDISSLGSLTNLTTLHLICNEITQISSLSSLTNLTTLNITYNEITEISSFGSLTNISSLRSLTNLTELSFGYSCYRIDPLSVLGELAQKCLTLSSTRPIDAQKATEAVKVAYATIGLEEPEVIICSSPRDAFLQIFNLLKCDRSQNYSNEWSWNRSGKKLNWKWMSPSIVREFASPLVWQYEFDGMRIEPEADSTLSSLMNDLVEEYKRSEETMGNIFSDHLFSLKNPETPKTLLKEIYLTELYISSLGVNLSQKAQEIHHCEKLLFEHCGFIFPFEKICVVCDRPRHLRFDSQNRLHAEGEPAIEFADGWNFYYYHGVKLPEKYGQVHPDLWKAEWLLSEDNAELKRVLIEGIGYDRIIQELAAEQIDSWQEYTLLKIDNADVEPIYLLKMTCPSTEFIHALRVPFNLTSAREAISWVNGGIDPE
jgi:internalin A